MSILFNKELDVDCRILNLLIQFQQWAFNLTMLSVRHHYKSTYVCSPFFSLKLTNLDYINIPLLENKNFGIKECPKNIFKGEFLSNFGEF